MRRLATAATLFALSMAIAGCGGGTMSSTPSPSPKPISVSISPSSINIATSQSRSFNATVSNDASGKGVTWSLTGAGCSDVECGVLSAVGSTSVIYTAPDTLPVPASVALTAAAIADASRTATTNVGLFEGGTISITISPASPSVDLGATVELTATVANDPSHGGVIWTMEGPTDYCSLFGCGGLSPKSTNSGQPTKYSAPQRALSPGPTLTIIATSMSDPASSGSVILRVNCVGSGCIP